MFVRRKKNRSGTTSVVVVDKSSGKFAELTTIGVASAEEDIRKLVAQGYDWISQYGGQRVNESGCMREAIISTEHKNGTFKEMPYPDGDRLIV